MVEVAAASDFSMSENMGGNDLRNPSMDLLNIHTNGAGMDDVDKLLQAFQPGQGSFDLPHDLAMDWNVAELHTSCVPDVSPASGPLPAPSMPQPQPFAGPVSRLGWSAHTPVPLMPSASTPAAASAPLSASPLSPHGSLGPGASTPGSDRSPGDSQYGAFPPATEPPPMRPAFPAIPRSARRASVPATAPGGASNFVTNQLFETRSTPPLWTIGEGDATDGPSPGGSLGAMGMRPAMSADGEGLPTGLHHHHHLGDGGATASSTGRRLRPSVRSASVGANSERTLSSSDLDLGLSGAKAKERNRRAQKRFRERQKVKQQEAVQRVVQLEEALDRLEVERSELSQRLQAMAAVRGGGDGDGGGPLATPLKAEDSGSEQQQMVSPASSSQERVLTLSVPQGRERHLTGSDIKKLTWPEYIGLYESYLEEMAAMLLQAQGNGDSPAGLRLQRLCTELITVTAAMLMHDPTTKGRLHCMPLMSQPVSTPLAPPDSNFWHRVTMALCLSPQQRQNCLRLRNAHLHKVRDIMQDRYRINDMMQSTLPSYDFELQAARQHLRALQVSENLQRNLRQEQGLQLELSTTFFSQALTPIQMATAATESYPWWPDILAMLNAACEGME